MNSKKFSEAMGEIGDKYINEAISYQKKRKSQSWVKWTSIAACLVVIVSIVALWQQGHNAPPITPSIDDPKPPVDSSDIYDANVFSLVAYTADTSDTLLTANYMNETTTTVLKPGLETMLPTYSPLMSNVPGFPFTANFTDETNGTIKISVDNGTIVEWNQETGVVSEIEKEKNIERDTTFYWSPISDENTPVENATITISIQNDKNIVATQNVNITSKDNVYYATIDELVSLSPQ